MQIIQVTYGYVSENLTNPNLYRISRCDDGNYGKHHIATRIKPVKNLTIEEFAESSDESVYGFIEVKEM